MDLRVPTPPLVSTCTPDTEECEHVFEITGYSKHKGIGHGGQNFIRSGVFYLGGCEWSMRYYPDGFKSNVNDAGNPDFISVYLVLTSKGSKVLASCELSVLDRSTGSWTSVHKTGPRIFQFGQNTAFAPATNLFMKKSELESRYLQDDQLNIKCVLTVMNEPRVVTKKLRGRIKVPPSNIKEDLGRLLETKEDTDVTFCVGTEKFAAHRLVLAMRSPVFKAELYGPMTEGTSRNVTVEDMHPDVFRALLRFIYTDSLHGVDDHEMICHLLVAADRYAVDRLKLMCQSILCEKLGVYTVATTLALAEQHNCIRLKDACLEFLTTSIAIDKVKATPGYKNLKKNCPSALADAFEKAME